MSETDLSALHDPALNHRTVIETIGGWQILGSDRRGPDYTARFQTCNTPIQLLYRDPRAGFVSIVTPCTATNGKFEFLIRRREPVRVCCYLCIVKQLRTSGAFLSVNFPNYKDWIVYMLMETISFLHGPAPRELPGK